MVWLINWEAWCLGVWLWSLKQLEKKGWSVVVVFFLCVGKVAIQYQTSCRGWWGGMPKQSWTFRLYLHHAFHISE